MIPTAQPVSTSELYFTPTRVNDSTVMMTVSPAEGAWWGIEYTLPRGENYVVKMRIVQHGMAAVAQSNNRSMAVNWHQDVRRQEKGRMFEERNSGLYYKPAGGGVDNLSENSDDSEEKQAKLRWIGFKNQFFSSVLVSDRPFNTADLSSKVLKGSDYLKSLDAQAVVNDYDWNADVPASFSLFLGPNLYPLLDSLDDNMVADEDMELTKLIPLGWNIFRWINTLIIIPLFNFFGSFGWNYGIIILLLTIFIKLVLFPLTYKSYKSQAKMRILAPDIKAINEKYPGNENAMTRQQKTMALYSKAGASPFSGCLPMLLQMPILFAMFSFFPSCIELRGESFLWAADLSAPDAIISWSAHIPIESEYFGNHISLFCLLMTATNHLYIPEHAELCRLDAWHEVDDVPDAGIFHDILQQLRGGPVILLFPLAAYHNLPDIRIPLLHQGGGCAQGYGRELEEAEEEIRLHGTPRGDAAPATADAQGAAEAQQQLQGQALILT